MVCCDFLPPIETFSSPCRPYRSRAEVTGPPKFLGNPFVYMPHARTPGSFEARSPDLRVLRFGFSVLPSAGLTTSASQDGRFRG